MILPFQNLRWCWTLLRILLITPGGLISNRRLSTLSTLLPQYHLFELNHVMIEIKCYTICIELHWEVIFLWKETTWSTFVLINGTIIDMFNVVFIPFYSLKPVLQAIYKFWVWKKKQGPWPKLEKCMKINTCKCIYSIRRVHTESWILEKVLKFAQQIIPQNTGWGSYGIAMGHTIPFPSKKLWRMYGPLWNM